MYVDINAAGCPNTCRHCSAKGHLPYGKLFSLEELRAIKNEWGPLTIRYEPTAHPNFPEIYHDDIAIENGGWLVTNGFGLAQRPDSAAVLEKLLRMGLHTLAFTLHGLQQHHDWFVCRPGAFDDILCATRGARAAGFSIVWQMFVDRRGIADVPGLVNLAQKEIGEDPSLVIPYHRVGGRLRHYQEIRLTLSDVKKHQLHQVIDDPRKNELIEPERLTSRAWLEKWANSTSIDDFRHPFEPPCWPPQGSFESLSIKIEADRKVYLDPFCHHLINLGKVAEGKEAIIERLEKLPQPPFVNLLPGEVVLSDEEQEQLHPAGFSLRYQEISKRLIQ
jgi:MoaA/NifB/PqqE/SkfB family radical SAM enzyme